MVKKIRHFLYYSLRFSERYFKTDMAYLTKGGFWLTAGKVESAFSSLVLALAFANLLAPEQYGIYKFSFSIFTILAISTFTSMAGSLTAAVAKGYEGSVLKALKVKITWGLFGSLGAILLAAYYFWNNNLTLGFICIIISLFVPLMDNFSTYNNYFDGRKLFKKKTIYGIISDLLGLIVMISALSITKNIVILILIYFFSWTIINFSFLQITITKLKPNNKVDPSAIPYGKHLSLMGVISTIAGQIDKILLWKFFGPIEIAIFSFSYTPVKQIRLFIRSIGGLSYPKISKKSVPELKESIPSKVLLLFIFIIPIVAIYILAAPFLFKFLFPQYLSSVIYSQILSLSLLAYPQTFFLQSFTGHYKKKELYIFNTVLPITKVILFFSLIPFFGVWGIVSISVIMELIGFILAFFLFLKLK